MATTFQTTDLIGAGIQFSYGANDDALFVLAGVTVASTLSTAINSSFDDNVLQVDGAVYASGQAITMHGANAVVTIGATGSVGTDYTAGGGAIYMNSLDGNLTNFGQISGNTAMGIITGSDNVNIENHGSISGASGVFLGLNGDTGCSLVNGGTVTASAYDDDARSYRFNNAVFSEGENTLVTNLAGGILSAISSEGAGIRFSAPNGSTAINYGEISSLLYYGVVFEGSSGDHATFKNFGTIIGGTGAFSGGDETDMVHNGGFMDGDVTLGAGDDVFKMKPGGSVNGSIFGDDDNDTIYGGNADDILFGGQNIDLLAGKAGDDSLSGDGGGDELRGGQDDDDLYGGAGNDTLFGGAGDDTLDGGFNNDTLDGGKGDDVLLGDKGNDVMDGGTGDDTLTGGNNLDT
ncbi:MAG: calcium-binding protein, partial [Hyphomicrobiales bacterium]|nr:calcium-binding protein [Hyphomicrobiales bacterium]